VDEPTRESADDSLGRRAFLGRLGLAGIGAASLTSALLAGCGSGGGDIPNVAALKNQAQAQLTDADILNFALNLEYLEAEFYLRAVTGSGLTAQEYGGDAAGDVRGGTAVNFTTPAIRQFAQEIASDERAHVNFLRTALGGAAVARPSIDFTTAFNVAAASAGLGNSFDPFANETNFLIGAFVFEDVGVTAYQGGAGLIRDLNILEAAAGILAVEAYHAGEIRTLLAQAGGTAFQAANAISNLRASAGGGKDQPLSPDPVTGNQFNFAPTDQNALVFGRTPSEVLRIVYLGGAGATQGGFFPRGLNGTVRTA
jgi:hypothetical protein